ncbi:MAG: hypothetical protein GX456_06135 [Verrucomicrobia bacterium]|nr:hypothetical protein [Verrucomicrobiota bacterium]
MKLVCALSWDDACDFVTKTQAKVSGPILVMHAFTKAGRTVFRTDTNYTLA